VGLMSLIYGM